MPIQFRCQYCRQRLGIADSRAGALVDCPACGRSLRVPTAAGTASPASGTATAKPEPDPHLQSALQQLSQIGAGAVPETADPPVAPTARGLPRKAANAPTPSLKSAISGTVGGTAGAHDPLKELASLPASPTHDLPVLAEPELLDDVGGDEETPAESVNHHAAESLAPSAATSNAAIDTAQAPIAATLAELAAHTQPISPATPRSPLRSAFPILIPVLTGLLMFTAGYLAARSANRRQQTPEPQAAAAASKPASPASTADHPTVAAGQISGLVEAANADGTTVPDAGALVIVAPLTNPSELRIDGRFLRDPPNSPGRLAITAALGQLGVRFTNAAEDGRFSLPLPAPGPCILIAVSRRNARPASTPLPAETTARLTEWFTSPSPVTGRLQTFVQPVTVPAGTAGVLQKVTIPTM
jgi:hypothetical protein